VIALNVTEQRALDLLLSGLDNRSLATRLGVDYNEVVRMVQALFAKVGVNNRTALAVWWWEQRHGRSR
jgi:DNA-binding CsgD family transcriptional regulator